MDIPITNYALLQNRVKYIEALIDFESQRDEITEPPTTITIQACEFATWAELITIFGALQTPCIDYTSLNIVHFIPLINFAEIFIVDCLKPYITKRFFTGSVNSATKSILWLVEHSHVLASDTYNQYLIASAKKYGTVVTNLHYALLTDNWLANFVTLRSHLRKTYSDKLNLEKWNFDKTCIQCNVTVQFDGRGIPHENLLRRGINWKCKTCDPDGRIKWFPMQRHDIM